jgi:hypothetical protein
LNLASFSNLLQDKLYIMGKQYNKILKRRRRAAYIAKRKLAVKELINNSSKSTKAKVSKPRVVRKTVTTKKEKVVEKKPEPVAEKAKPIDVLGPKAVKDAAPKEEKAKVPQKESKDSTES